MRRFALPSVVLLALLMSVIVGPASAEIVIAEYDVFNDGGNWLVDQFVTNGIIGETFTATVTGTVSSVQVAVSRAASTTIPMSWEIRSTFQAGYNGLQPDFTATGLLSTGTLAASDVSTALVPWITVQMTPVELVAGQDYALVASAIGTNCVYRWWCKSAATTGYGGRHLTGYYGVPQDLLGSASWDLGFRVLAVPEPSSIVALLGGMVGFVGLVRRRA